MRKQLNPFDIKAMLSTVFPTNSSYQDQREYSKRELNKINLVRRQLKTQLEGKANLKQKNISYIEFQLDETFYKLEFYIEKLKELKKIIKNRNREIHNRSTGNFDLESEMIQVLKESYKDLYNTIRVKSIANRVRKNV